MTPSLLVVVLGVFSGCTPRDLQYVPRGEELAALTRLAGQFAEGELAVEQVDVEARRALLIFGASLAYEQRERVRAAVDQVNARIVLALAFQVLGGWTPAQAEASIARSVEEESRALEAQLEGELGVSPRQLVGGQGDLLSAVASQLREPPAQAAERLVASRKEASVTACRFSGLLTSYDVSLLRFTSWAHADRSKGFVAWKRRARSLHLAEVHCDGQRGVVLLSGDDRQDAPRVVAWRFSSPAQHAQFVERLRAALGPR